MVFNGPVSSERPKGWAPCQERALKQLFNVMRIGAPLVELRSPPGRGHGITTVLRTFTKAIGSKAVLLDVASTLGDERPEERLFKQAEQHLQAGDIVVIDDADVASRPRMLRASRNAGDQFRGSGNYAFEDAAEPMRLLKALQDRADQEGGSVVFSTVEEGHARYMQVPLVVKLDHARAEDFAVILGAILPGVACNGLLNRFPVAPSISELRCAVLRAQSAAAAGASSPSASSSSSRGGGEGSGEASFNLAQLERALRANFTSDAAVQADEVEHIELAVLPGMAKIVQTLETHMLYPIQNPEEAKKQGLIPKRGVLLYGPPGTGKTTIGRALAHRLKGRFFMIKELLLYKEMLDVFAQARAVAPSVVFFDDIDVLLGGLNGITEGARGHDLTRFLLSQMDGLCTTPEAQVIVVMAAADAKFLPPAILRSGRIELWLKTEKPKPRERKGMLQHYIECAQRSAATDAPPLLRDPYDLDEVVRVCEDFVPADVRRIVSDARNAAAADGVKKSGGYYLKEAATDLRAMKEDVEGLVGRMYG